MRHPDQQPGTALASPSPERGGWGLQPWLGGLFRWLRRPGRHSQAEAIRVGYALRRRQEANLQRLACPACRPPRPATPTDDSGGIPIPVSADGHGGRRLPSATAPTAAPRPGSQRQPVSVVSGTGHESSGRTYGTP